jgi:hypothetical protein
MQRRTREGSGKTHAMHRHRPLHYLGRSRIPLVGSGAVRRRFESCRGRCPIFVLTRPYTLVTALPAIDRGCAGCLGF